MSWGQVAISQEQCYEYHHPKWQCSGISQKQCYEYHHSKW